MSDYRQVARTVAITDDDKYRCRKEIRQGSLRKVQFAAEQSVGMKLKSDQIAYIKSTIKYHRRYPDLQV